MNNFKFIIAFLVFFSGIKSLEIYGQNDSVALETIIRQVIVQHPSVQSAQEALKNADARIDLAKSSLRPMLEGNVSYTRIGPVPSITIPDVGTLQMASNNIYNASVNYYQNLYDFGKTGSEVAIEKENKELVKITIEQLKQRLAISAVNVFYSLAYYQEALNIKETQLKTLEAHLSSVEKRKETGSATQYEILATKVKISAIESQKVDILAAIRVQQSVLNTLAGYPENTPVTVRPDLSLNIASMSADSLISFAMNNRDEIKISNEKRVIAELKYKSVKTRLNPVLNAFASAGGKNGYFPNLDMPKANFAVGLGFKVPILDAGRNKNNVVQAKSEMTSSFFDTEVAKRAVINEVVESDAGQMAAVKKIEQFNLQLMQAKEALNLAEKSYQNGTITNLDLLDAATSLSESRLQLLKARIDYALGQYRLKAALGERLY